MCVGIESDSEGSVNLEVFHEHGLDQNKSDPLNVTWMNVWTTIKTRMHGDARVKTTQEYPLLQQNSFCDVFRYVNIESNAIYINFIGKTRWCHVEKRSPGQLKPCLWKSRDWKRLKCVQSGLVTCLHKSWMSGLHHNSRLGLLWNHHLVLPVVAFLFKQ